MFAVLEIWDYILLAMLICLFTGGAAVAQAAPPKNRRLKRVEEKLDLVLAELGVEYQEPSAPDGFPDEVKQLADSGQKIAAIRELRAATGLGLKEAKEAVEELFGDCLIAFKQPSKRK